jgi:hypothetical protein
MAVNTYLAPRPKGDAKPPLQLRNFQGASVATHSPILVTERRAGLAWRR